MTKAVVLEEFGSAPVLRTVERPMAAPGEVVVRVEASGVNPLDVKNVAGSAGHARVTPPMVLGMDLAGVVTELGEGVPILTGNGRPHHGEILRSVAGLVDAGKITPILDPQAYQLADVAEAHRKVADGTARGKVVVRIGHHGTVSLSGQRDERDPAAPGRAALGSGHGQGGGERQGSRR